MKKIIGILISFIILNICLVSVYALECDYGDFSISINEASGYSQVTSGNYNITEKLSDLLKKEKKCVYIYKCERFDTGLGISIPYRGLYPDFASASEAEYDVDKDCKHLDVGGKEVPRSEGNCVSFNTYYAPLIESLGKYNTCQDLNCKYSVKSDLKNQFNYLQSVCNKVLGSAQYDDPCSINCLNLKKDEKYLDAKKIIFGSGGGDSECGFSDRLIGFIANIVKWTKFVIPVLVIIFGILDFIKAVGADKEDEMKKAQGKFAKRLIAAALIFIVPFILEFILNKMGFIPEGCGIIDF